VRQTIEFEQVASIGVPFSSEFKAFVRPCFIKHFVCHERRKSGQSQAIKP